MSNSLEALFEQWRERPIHKGQLFVIDGIIDREKWERSPIRILFLLKEAYDSGTRLLDVCKLVREEWGRPKFAMWWRLAEWAYGISNLLEGSIAPFPKCDEERNEAARCLLASAVVNVKKSGGRKNSDPDDLRRYVESDWDLIREQIRLINPEIVICGYTWPLIKDQFGKGEVSDAGDLLYKVEGTYFVDFWHPANHYPSKLNYYTLCALCLRADGLFRWPR